MTLGESTADTVEIKGGEITLAKVFTLSPDARINIKNVSGSITITTWNKPQAELRAIKKGSTPDEGAQTFIRTEQGNLSIRTASGRRSNTDVRYELKIPLSVDNLQVETVNGGIRISDVTGDSIRVETTNGTIDLTNILGALNAETTNGNVNVVMSSWKDERLSLSTTNGNISLQLKGEDINAELDAKADHGAVSVDDSFGVNVERQMMSQRARGTIGKGGEQIGLKTVNGSIRVSR
jgi:DUF4097 and DUF4098 domain-containing protein YvlB